MIKTKPLTAFLRDRGFTAASTADPLADLVERSGSMAPAAGESAPEGRWDPTYEVEGPWSARPFRASGPKLGIRRFVDGSARVSILAYAVDPTGDYVALVGGVVGAMCRRRDEAGYTCEPPQTPDLHARRVVAMATEGFDPQDLRVLRRELRQGEIRLLDVTPRMAGEEGIIELGRARVAAHTRILTEMQAMERVAAEGPDGEPDAPTVVDGKLGHHLAAERRHRWPMLGVVKRHAFMPLPTSSQACVMGLRDGHRSPAVRVVPPSGTAQPEMLTWYVKLAPGGADPLKGVIRLEGSRLFLEESAPQGDVPAWLDTISREIRSLRAVQAGYGRKDCSLQPIVTLEKHLKGRGGVSRAIEHKVRRALGL